MNTGKLHAWQDQELRYLASVLEEALLGWREAWGLAAGNDAAVSCTPADSSNDEGWEPLRAHAAPGAWVIWSDVARSQLQSLFGAGQSVTALALEAAAACEQDATRRLALALLVDPGVDRQAEALPRGKWSGAAVATLPCGSRLLMAASCIHRVLGVSGSSDRLPRKALPSLSSILQAASGCKTRVEARLADCELDLLMLRRLQVGDVVRLAHPLTRPLSVHVAGDLPVFDGYLARSDGRRALELLAASAGFDGR